MRQTAEDAPSAPLILPARQSSWLSRPFRASGRGACALAAVLTWLALVAASTAAVQIADLNPLTTRGALFPLAVGGLAALVLAAVAWWRSSELVAAVAAGALAAWVWFIMFQGLHGTPFPFDGLSGDAGRLAALVTRYTVTWKPADQFVPSVPTEYPPLFPYVVGHLAAVVHHPGWELLGPGEALLESLTVLFGFLLWRRLVPGYLALLLAAVPPYTFPEPRKAFEILTYALGLPWALATFSRFRQAGGLHWLPAGVIVGLIVQTYQGFAVFGILGLAAMAVQGWRAATDRTAYVRHVALVAVVGFVVASWYLVPFIYGVLVLHSQRVDDLFVSGEIHTDPLGISMFTAHPIGLINAIGLAGLVVLRRRWWAAPMLALAVGTLAYRYLYLAVFVLTGHTGNFDYTSRLLAPLLASAGILTLATLAGTAAQRMTLPNPRRTAVVITVATLVVFTASEALDWLPTPIGVEDTATHPLNGAPNQASYAHTEILPNGQRVRYADTHFRVAVLLAAPISQLVHRVLGPGVRPRTLSYSERLFAYVPWNGYAGTARLAANSFTHWDDRHAALVRLAAVTDPAAFAQASRHTRYGAIDVFVLSEGADGTWNWDDVRFAPSVFVARYWRVLHLAHHTVVAVRKRGPSAGRGP